MEPITINHINLSKLLLKKVTKDTNLSNIKLDDTYKDTIISRVSLNDHMSLILTTSEKCEEHIVTQVHHIDKHFSPSKNEFEILDVTLMQYEYQFLDVWKKDYLLLARRGFKHTIQTHQYDRKLVECDYDEKKLSRILRNLPIDRDVFMSEITGTIITLVGYTGYMNIILCHTTSDKCNYPFDIHIVEHKNN